MAEGSWWSDARRWVRPLNSRRDVRVGLALGGGFARGIAHIGVLRVFEQEKIPIHFISGVSAGAIVAAAFASGASSDEIDKVASTVHFSDLAQWRFSKYGLVGSDPMIQFLARLLKVSVFERMKIPLAVIATDLNAGGPAVFPGQGRRDTSHPRELLLSGLFQPLHYQNHCLVDGMISMDVPAAPLRRMGATHVVSVTLPMPAEVVDPRNMLSVVTRCFQIMNSRAESQWRRHSNVVIAPEVSDVGWNAFESSQHLVDAGERAARAVLPHILKWFPEREPEGGEAVA